MVENDRGRKGIAKLMLNSFWGEFGQRNNMTKTKFIHDPKKFYDMCRSKAIKLRDIHAVDPKCMMATSTPRENFNEDNHGSNIDVAAFTTSHARLKLLDTMKKLGDLLLYFDTDSVTFT